MSILVRLDHDGRFLECDSDDSDRLIEKYYRRQYGEALDFDIKRVKILAFHYQGRWFSYVGEQSLGTFSFLASHIKTKRYSCLELEAFWEVYGEWDLNQLQNVVFYEDEQAYLEVVLSNDDRVRQVSNGLIVETL